LRGIDLVGKILKTNEAIKNIMMSWKEETDTHETGRNKLEINYQWIKKRMTNDKGASLRLMNVE
jgi:hypothetical protein